MGWCCCAVAHPAAKSATNQSASKPLLNEQESTIFCVVCVTVFPFLNAVVVSEWGHKFLLGSQILVLSRFSEGKAWSSLGHLLPFAPTGWKVGTTSRSISMTALDFPAIANCSSCEI